MNLHTGQTQTAQSLFDEFKAAYPNEQNFTQLLQEMFDDLQKQQAPIAAAKPSNETQTQLTSSESHGEVPAAFALEPNYPNPFNPVTTIRYQLPEAGHVLLRVYDMLGREVAKLVDGVQPAGEHEVRFDASELGTGVYVYRLQAAGEMAAERMLVVK